MRFDDDDRLVRDDEGGDLMLPRKYAVSCSEDAAGTVRSAITALDPNAVFAAAADPARLLVTTGANEADLKAINGVTEVAAA